MMQPFTENLIKIPYNITDYSRGGQPYKFNPADFGVKGEYLNLGYRDYPRENWIPYYVAEEYGLGVDLDYIINVEAEEGSTNDIIANLPFLQTAEQKKIYNDCGKREWGHYMISNYVPSRTIYLTGKNGLYQDLVAMKKSQHTYVSESGFKNGNSELEFDKDFEPNELKFQYKRFGLFNGTIFTIINPTYKDQYFKYIWNWSSFSSDYIISTRGNLHQFPSKT
jgi:hypothetical protein